MFTQYIRKYLGFKGLTFIVAIIGLFEGRLESGHFTTIVMAISGLKAVEDHLRK